MIPAMSTPLTVVVWLLLFILSGSALPGQNSLPPTGVPPIRNYPPSEYNAHNQNWAIVQDRRGVMYFGNNNGILEYDGVSWQLIPTPGSPVVRSLTIDDTGRIFAGGVGEFGYLAPDTVGRMRFVSLLPGLGEEYRDFSDVWQTLAIGKSIYFVTQKFIFRWDGRHIRVWKAQSSFHVGFAVNDRFYVRQREIGLMELVSDSLSIIPGGAEFAGERIMAMLPFASGEKSGLLLATRTNGLLLYDGLTSRRFVTEADDLFSEGQIYSATRLTNGWYAFGTLQNGIVVIDPDGHLRYHLHKGSGLQDDTIWFLYEDVQNSLWVGMHYGVSRIEIASPFTYFGEKEGLEGSAMQITRHQGVLYVASSMGIYHLDETPGSARTSGRFRKMPDISPQGWALLPFNDVMLAGVFDGVYEIKGNSSRVVSNAYTMSLHRSGQDPDRVFVGMQSGLKAISYEKGQWRDEGRVEGVDYEIRNIYETPDGKLWLSTYNNGLLLVDFSSGFHLKPSVMLFDTLNGLPSNIWNVPFDTRKGLRFATRKGIFRFNETSGRFSPDTSLVIGLGNAPIFSVSEDHRGDLWMVHFEKSNSGMARLRNDNRYKWEESSLLRIRGIDTYVAYPDPLLDGITWLGCIDRVIRYDQANSKDAALPFRTLIREVISNGDSLLFGGVPSGKEGGQKIKFANNSLRFRFAAPVFDDEQKTLYQYRLEGYDKDWSGWSSETYKDFTRLPPGTYRFLVRARDLYGTTGETAVYAFRITPPFYLAWWAYIFYGVLLVAGLAKLLRYQQHQLRRKHQREMEQMEYDKLRELDQLKSDFFTNISHEFRTPLTLILGPVEKLLSENPGEEETRQFLMVKRNAQRLLRLINQLLDLSKFDAGKMNLEMQYADIIPLLRGVVSSFESVAQKVNLQFKNEMEAACLHFDPGKMEQILNNLVSNALKFTPEDGKVTVEVTLADDGKSLRIDVTDTGPGIPEAHLPYVFDRFYQATEISPGGEAGSGIGLALTRELVILHRGDISVRNTESGGACFTVLLPFPKEPQGVTGSVRKPEIRSVVPVRETVITETVLPSGAEDPAKEITLLLVEDNPDMRTFLRESLSGSYCLLEAPDGREGINLALEHIPDLVISDVMMPRKDGLQLCEALKNDERTSHIPIILLTARADIASRIAGLERGADDYLAKPFHRKELLIRTRNLLEGRRRLHERYGALPAPVPSENRDIRIEDVFLRKIRGIVEVHLSDETFEIDQLARQAGMSRSQLFRKIKALTGGSPSIFIRTIRLHRAKELLQNTSMNVSEVACEVGFSTPAYFSDMFLETYGVRPSQLRK